MANRVSRVIGILAVVLSLLLPSMSVTDVAAQGGFPLTANTAYCEPGYLGPFVDCTPWERVVVSFVASDQDYATSCVTVAGGRTASCTVEVPFGATIVASIDPGVVPAGYVLEGPASMEVVIPDGPPEGEFGGPAFVLLPALNEPPVEEPTAGGFPLSANSAYCEPGYLGPFVDCEPWQGVTVTFETTDGAFATSCVTSGTERAAGCVVEVPFGSTVVASIDPGIVPAGYVLGKPASQEILIPDGPPEGEFGGAVFVLLPAAQGASEGPIVAAGPTAPVVAAPETGGQPAGLYSGTCADPNVAAPVAELNGLRVPGGTRVGAADAVPVATSYTMLSVPFDQVVDGAHLVAIFDDADPATMVACGAIGGALDENGALSVGLQPMGGGGTAGVAYLRPGDNDSTVVSIFAGQLAPPVVPSTATPTEPAADASSDLGVSQQGIEGSEEAAQIKVNYLGCPVGTDMNAGADTLTAACKIPVAGSLFQVAQGNDVVKETVSPAAPGGFWLMDLAPVDTLLAMMPAPRIVRVFCQGSTPTLTTMAYGPVQVQDIENNRVIELDLIPSESVERDWFVLARNNGRIQVDARTCPIGFVSGNKTVDEMRVECPAAAEGTVTFQVTSGQFGATGTAEIYVSVPEGTPTIAEGVPDGYELQEVMCQMSLDSMSPSPWNDGPVYSATIVAGNAVTEPLKGEFVLDCTFFNVPVSGGVVSGDATAAVVSPVTATRLRDA